MPIDAANKYLYYFNKGFNYSQDGPGNRLVYHLKGCNMSCPWCANPEGMGICSPEHYEKGSCPGVKCADLNTVIAEVQSCSPMFFPEGGVTFTGGEPTLQFDALSRLLVSLKNMGIHTALESNASHPRLPNLFEYIDFLMLDFKHPIPEKHLSITGIPSEIIRRNIKLAAESRNQLAIRIPLISGYNTSDSDMEKYAEFFTSLNGKEHITLELLPYHEYGRDKYKKLGLPYTVENAFISQERLSSCREILSECGIKLINS